MYFCLKLSLMKKSFFYITCLFLLLLMACEPAPKKKSNLLSLVPSQTAAVLKTDDFSELAQSLSSNTFIKNNPELPLFSFFKSAYAPLAKLKLSGESLLCFSVIGRNDFSTTLITPITPNLLDSIGYKTIEGYLYNGQKIKKYTLNDKLIYGAKLRDLFVFGDAKLVVENVIRLSGKHIPPNKSLQKVYETSDREKDALFINPPEFKKLLGALLPKGSAAFLSNFSNWTALDLNINDQSIQISGITLPQRGQVLGLFQNVGKNPNKIAHITPVGAIGFYSFTYDELSQLKENLSFLRKRSGSEPKLELLKAIAEIGEIYTHATTALALRSVNLKETKSILQQQGDLLETHRNHKIYSFSKPDYFYQALHPLVKLKGLKFYTQIESFFVFAQDLKTLEYIIANTQNKTVLTARQSYKETAAYLSEESSILFVGISKNLRSYIADKVKPDLRDKYASAALSDYNYESLQFIDHGNFTYINGVFAAVKPSKKQHGGIQVGSLKLGEKVANGPWFFVNWNTQHYDIVVQGESDSLYVFNENGKLRWTQALDGPILGDIQEIDIYQNHRIQMAFVTPHTFYIIDREGNIVAPFDQEFERTITEPLAIFDYYDSGRFRFLITQGRHLKMLDKHLDPVKGFEFEAAKSRIRYAPKHFRIGTKDYIVLQEASGQLHLLNVRGETRIPVKHKIAFSDNSWYLYQDQFTSTNANGELLQINENGDLSKKDLNLETHHQIAATAHILVSLSGNKISINGNTATLSYGIFTKPQIFMIGEQAYIATTDTQAHKVYLFDQKAQLLPGFPVYGNSAIDLKDMDHRGGPELIVKGEDDSILIYEVE